MDVTAETGAAAVQKWEQEYPTSSQEHAETEKQNQSKTKTWNGLDDDFLMNNYKMLPCKRKYAHDWASCPCGHKGERAARRDLQTYPYMAIACQYAKQRMSCPFGDGCSHAHNLFEYWLHPQRFKTELCQFGTNCDRPVCFFGHSVSELRPLDPNLPPAEARWSAGAALSNKSHYATHRQQQLLIQQQQQQYLAMAAAGAPDYLGQERPAVGGVLQASTAVGGAQQQQQMLLLAPGVYSTSAAPVATHQQHLMQPAHALGLSVAAAGGVVSMPMCNSRGQLPSVSAAAMPSAYIVAQQQLPSQAQPQLQSPDRSGLQAVQYGTPAGNQQAYMLSRLSNTCSSATFMGSNPQEGMQQGVSSSMPPPGLQPGMGAAMQVATGGMMLDSIATSQLAMQARPNAYYQPTTGGQQQPQASMGAFVQAGALNDAGVVVCTALPALPSSAQWQQYALYPAATTVQTPGVDGVLVDLQGMQL